MTVSAMSGQTARSCGGGVGVRGDGVPGGGGGGPVAGEFTRTGRRRFRQAATEDRLAAKLEKVTERLRPARRTWSGPART